ncbi:MULTISPECIES: family 43 glycosylhydrolase [unclassified Arcicella]|uniref:family 43 glycosylhydrolase n=1 Tax=unclassified Arcicella TaxID=2644986 RepID=UPI00285CFD3A|nr:MULTISPECIES: family 43 glycosylhydrolase [unclassified Arcicella]MDR6562433.1 beta-xylosidase [Arcicella sp. BE51]MDR6812327.1 beta-xylosidase [Arcicella sp. BE140]MDR6823658.1 beta-xylosidase [Arcicella sp. BE139]
MTQRILLLSSIFLLCFQLTQAQKSVNNNPVIPDLIADPSIVQFGDTFYCYATTDGYNKGLATAGPPVLWSSKDLKTWSFKGFYFPAAEKQLFWAPSYPVKVKDKYYYYPTVNHDIYVAVADSPAGPFSLAKGDFSKANAAPLLKMDAPKGTKGIDAEVFIDDDQKPYLFWAQRGAGRLNPDMVSLDTASIVKLPTKRGGYSEGPIFFKRKGIYYYLYTLSGHENYVYAYQYSKVSPFGPFIYPEEDIIAKTDVKEQIYGPGHGNVFHIKDDYYFTYLEFGRSSTNRQVWIDKMEFNEDGTIKPIQLTNKGVDPFPSLVKKGIEIQQAEASSTLADYKVPYIKDKSINRTETYLPQNALDGANGTRWMAKANDSTATFTVNLGKKIAIKKVESYFVKPTAGHAYVLEYSIDNKSWKPYGGHADIKIQSPHIDERSVKAQYLRLTFLKGTAGLWEFRVF